MIAVIFIITLYSVLIEAATKSCGDQKGILINGYYGGTQLFDPYCTDQHATGNVTLGLQTGDNAIGGTAVINGHLAYFGSGYSST